MIDFEGLKKIGDPTVISKDQLNDGIDEFICNDIVASLYRRKINYKFKAKRKGDVAFLTASIQKVKRVLNWEPLMDIDTAIKETAVWYENFFLKKEIYELTIEQINKYL